MKKFSMVIMLLLTLSSIIMAQTYQGPGYGVIDRMVVRNTDSYTRAPLISDPLPRATKNKLPYITPNEISETDLPLNLPSAMEIYQEANLTEGMIGRQNSVITKLFDGLDETNSIPPDPHIAAGPDHLVATVNSDFGIYDKEGNLLKRIDADSWYRPLLSSVGAFDPKVIYDQFEERFVMVWLSQSDADREAYFLISVSDDSDPLGEWYNYLIPTHIIGENDTESWGDYQGVGYNSQAIFITSNQFAFDGGFQYARLSIVPKAPLYGGSTEAFEYIDFWDFRYPHNTRYNIFNIRPVIMLDESDDYYFVHTANSNTNYYVLIKLTGMANWEPEFESKLIDVTPYGPPPKADQLGGSTLDIENGGAALKNEPVYQDGKLYITHAVSNPEYTSYSAIRYAVIDVETEQPIEQITYGANKYWHFYPAVMVDDQENVAITFSRSGLDEYIGAFYISKEVGSETGFEKTITLSEGRANYVKDYGSERNRWGDYMGISIDPVDKTHIWMMTEFAVAEDTWDNKIAAIKIVPDEGVSLQKNTFEIDFGDVEAHFLSDTSEATVLNFGTDAISITNISVDDERVELPAEVDFPVNLSTYETLTIPVVFAPDTAYLLDATINFESNDPEFEGVSLFGNGFQINPALADVQLYASTGVESFGKMLAVDVYTGEATELGESNYNELLCLDADYATGLMYAIANTNPLSIVRVNALKGDCYPLMEIPELTDITSMAIDTLGAMFLARREGTIYRVDFEGDSLQTITKSKAAIQSIAFDPATNELWATIFKPLGSSKDYIYKVDLATGDTTVVGRTGFGKLISDFGFAQDGNIWGILPGALNESDSLFQIDRATGTGKVLGAFGFDGVTGLAFNHFSAPLVGVENSKSNLVPKTFVLEQNFPNPFNPSTTIRYALPEAASVSLIVYNMLGEQMFTLSKGIQSPGMYEVVFNSNDGGYQLSSGVYFYEIIANGNAKVYRDIKKMVLVK